MEQNSRRVEHSDSSLPCRGGDECAEVTVDIRRRPIADLSPGVADRLSRQSYQNGPRQQCVEVVNHLVHRRQLAIRVGFHEMSLPGLRDWSLDEAVSSVDPAATVIVLSPDGDEFDVLMVERNSRGFFGSLWVFPGGGVGDADLVGDEDLSHRRAAMRELGEEAGFVLTPNAITTVPEVKDSDYYSYLTENEIEPALDSLVLISRWVTPVGAPRRFDTWFYLATCDPRPAVRLDSSELLSFEWVKPAEALDRHESGAWPMFPPTIAHLRWLTTRRGVRDALDSARGADGRTLIEPRRLEDGSLLPIHMPAP